jgi:hypothetical protein
MNAEAFYDLINEAMPEASGEEEMVGAEGGMITSLLTSVLFKKVSDLILEYGCENADSIMEAVNRIIDERVKNPILKMALRSGAEALRGALCNQA